MTNVEDHETHKYDHLGKAPFYLVGYIYDPPIQDHNGAWHGGTHSCAHCGQSIMHVFMCKSSDGKQFDLGSVHVEYLGDKGLSTAVKDKMREVRAAAREAKRQAEWEAKRPEREAAQAEFVRRETLDRAIELIPNKKYPDDGNGDNDDQNYGRNKVIDEFRSSLEQEKGGTP